MPVIAAAANLPRALLGRRGIAAAIAVGAAGALSVATLSSPTLTHVIGEGVSASVEGMKTVAAMLAERSPGERPEGALANLKRKRQTALHERALPKVRGPGPTAYEALAGPPLIPPIAPLPETPLFNTVAGAPVPIVPVSGGSSGGPPALSNIPLPGGGGGGGFFSPPVTQATPEVPPTPVTPVPEPATWMTMILGFALIGRALRRRPVPLGT